MRVNIFIFVTDSNIILDLSTLPTLYFKNDN